MTLPPGSNPTAKDLQNEVADKDRESDVTELQGVG